MAQQVVIHVEHVGRLGNTMIQYMAALALMQRVPGAVLYGVHIPEWNIWQPDLRPREGNTFVVHRDTAMRMPLEEIEAQCRAGVVNCVEIRNYVQHMDNFLSADVYRRTFADTVRPGVTLGPDDLLINLRGDEILTGGAMDYVLPPVAYFEQIVEETGLVPVFMGQLTPSPYLERIKRAFPDARMIDTLGVMEDFALIRSARAIVLSISTFTWLAAFLSNAERIFFPVAGLFSPAQRADIMLLPYDDPRYRFDLFPIYFAVPGQAALEHHDRIEGLWRRLPGPVLHALMHGPPRFAFDLDAIAPFFEEAYYLEHNWDIRGAVAHGHIASGFEHYARSGCREARRPFDMNVPAYCNRYPVAACELAARDFTSPHHHYVAVGRHRGYERFP